MDDKKKELIEALTEFVIRVAKEEDAAPSELEALVGIASILFNEY